MRYNARGLGNAFVKMKDLAPIPIKEEKIPKRRHLPTESRTLPKSARHTNGGQALSKNRQCSCLPAPGLPPAPEADPKGDGNKAKVEPEGLLADIEKIIVEFVAGEEHPWGCKWLPDRSDPVGRAAAPGTRPHTLPRCRFHLLQSHRWPGILAQQNSSLPERYLEAGEARPAPWRAKPDLPW